MEVLRLMFDMLSDALFSLFGYLCLLWGLVVQFLILWSTKEKLMRWLLPVLFGGGAVAFVALILLTESFFSLLAIALLPYLILVLAGTLIGAITYKIWTRVHSS